MMSNLLNRNWLLFSLRGRWRYPIFFNLLSGSFFTLVDVQWWRTLWWVPLALTYRTLSYSPSLHCHFHSTGWAQEAAHKVWYWGHSHLLTIYSILYSHHSTSEEAGFLETVCKLCKEGRSQTKWAWRWFQRLQNYIHRWAFTGSRYWGESQEER